MGAAKKVSCAQVSRFHSQSFKHKSHIVQKPFISGREVGEGCVRDKVQCDQVQRDQVQRDKVQCDQVSKVE